MDKPDGNGSVGQASMNALTWVTRVQVPDVTCQSVCCREVPSSIEPPQAAAAQETSPVHLRSKIGSLQQASHHACPGGIFAEVEIPPPLNASVDLPELVFADAVSLEGEERCGQAAAGEELSPATDVPSPVQGFFHAAKTNLSQSVTVSKFSKRWKERLPSKRWWLDTAWNLACVGAMLALALIVRQWLFSGADGPSAEKTLAGSVTEVHNHEDPLVSPVELEKLAGPVGRITDQLPMADSPLEQDVMTGPLTDMGIEQVNFIERE